MFMRKFEAEIYSLMRIMIGFMFLWHGAQKLLEYPSAPSFVDSNPNCIKF